MKKSYSLIVLLFIGALVLLSLYISTNKTSKKLTEGNTPKELWDMQFQKKKEKRKHGYSKADKPDLFTQYFKDITTRIGEKDAGYKMNYKIEEFAKAKQQRGALKAAQTELDFISRGPANVGGRTRALIVDPDDAAHNTWYAGAATGGIWKTMDGGIHWQNLSDQFTNLSVNALAMAASNRNVMYAGTGESFPGGTGLLGNGIWKSADRGATWIQLTSTATDLNFGYINRLIIDPTNADIVLAATETGIYKSINGGTNWTEVYKSTTGVEDLVEDPTDFNVQFAGENSIGVLRSSNAGDSWVVSSTGLGDGGRYEIAVSSVNHNKVFTSVDVTTDRSNVYMSTDNGLTWIMFSDGQSFLGGQGMYDNTIEAHPFDENVVFVGGVDLWKINFNGTAGLTAPTLKKAYTENANFLSFVNFGGAFLGGGMDTTDHVNRVKSDWVSVEIRFGAGLSQKAHRFTVPNQATSGVPASSYSYADYVEVPFQVWDVTNNKQLMVSFRDQEKDNDFNLYARTGEGYGQLGREYIFINAMAYNATTPNANIAKNGGHLYKALAMIWPVLADGASWSPNNLPSSKIIIDYGTFYAFSGEKTSIADSYGNFGGPNGYNQGAGFGETKIPGLHPDHHNIVIIPTGENIFTLLDANDGGLGISFDSGQTFNMLTTNYITTQFYGVAKNPEANEYIGGMQDNGTWQSAKGETGSDTSHYLFRIGGDGFECIWNAENPKYLLGSVYNNSIQKSINGGNNWFQASNGITSGDGPFITRLSASKQNSKVVFAVGAAGVYKTIEFGSSWELKAIDKNWIYGSLSSAANVEVSLANGNIVWAGSGMASGFLNIHVSTDEGETFIETKNYTEVEMGAYTSGIATHPTEPETAYVLFSLKGFPKVLRTEDLGQTWNDISGFGKNSTSSNGFPDVVIHTLLVMPHAPNTIWVGTDIGLFETTDNGLTWHIFESGLPPVSVYAMQIVGNQVVIATHGRGIWSVDIPEITNVPFIKNFAHVEAYNLNFTSDFKVTYNKAEVYMDGLLNKTIDAPALGNNEISVTVTSDGNHSVYILGYVGEKSYQSNSLDIEFEYAPISISENVDKTFSVYPNPSDGLLNLKLSSGSSANTSVIIQVFDIRGLLVYSGNAEIAEEINLDLTSLKSGAYVIKVKSDRIEHIQKIVIQK